MLIIIGRIDAERLIKVREVIDDQHLVYGDWNCGATPLDAIRTSRKVAHLRYYVRTTLC